MYIHYIEREREREGERERERDRESERESEREERDGSKGLKERMQDVALSDVLSP